MILANARLIIAPRQLRAGDILPDHGQALCSAAEGTVVWIQNTGPACVPMVEWQPPFDYLTREVQPQLDGIEWEPEWEENDA